MKLRNLNFGGIAPSPYQGQQGSVADLVALDIHSVPGEIFIEKNAGQAPYSNSDSDNRFIKMLDVGDNYLYFFGESNGAVYRRTKTVGVYAAISGVTLSPTSGNRLVSNAEVFNGKVYYAMEEYIGQWEVGTDWSTRNDSFGNFAKEWGYRGINYPEISPMAVLNDTLFIGNNNVLAQVDSSENFTAEALDLPEEYTITSLAVNGTSLLIGTHRQEGGASIFEWDTISTTWNAEYRVDSHIVNCIFHFRGAIVAQIGNNGDLYTFNGSGFSPWKKVPNITNPYKDLGGDLDPINMGFIFHNRVVEKDGDVYFLGNGFLAGLWKLSSYDSNFPAVFTKLYDATVPTCLGLFRPGGAYADILIWNSGDVDDWVNIEYFPSETIPSEYFDVGYFTTQTLDLETVKMQTLRIQIPYKEIPSGTSVEATAYINYDHTGQEITLVNDTQRKMLRGDLSLVGVNTVSFQIRLNTNTGGDYDKTPIIRGLDISLV